MLLHKNIKKLQDIISKQALFTSPFILSLITFLTFCFFPVYSQELLYQNKTEKINNKTIACLLPLSGKYEVIGKKALRGILTARNLFQSGNDIQIIVKDYGDSDPELNKAIDEVVTKDNASVVIGPLLSSSIKEVSSSVKSLRVPAIVFPLSREVSLENPYIISFSYPVEKQAHVLARYAVQDIKITSLGILYPRSDLGELFKEAFIKSTKEFGGEIIYIGSYDPKLLDISTEIGWINSRRPKAIFVPDAATHSGEIVLKLRRENGLEDLILLGPNTWNSRSFLKTVGFDVNGLIFTDFFFSGSERWIDFSNKFRAAFHEEPGFFEYQVYEAASLIFHVLQNPIQRREQIKERILTLRDNPLLDIIQNIDGSLEISPKPLILTINDGEIVRVK